MEAVKRTVGRGITVSCQGDPKVSNIRPGCVLQISPNTEAILCRASVCLILPGLYPADLGGAR